jgi:hypothetical protein
MVTEKLSPVETYLMYRLYENLVLDRKTPGQCREIYNDSNAKFKIADFESLEKKGLASLDESLLIAGSIICPNITSKGIKCVEKLLAA